MPPHQPAQPERSAAEPQPDPGESRAEPEDTIRTRRVLVLAVLPVVCVLVMAGTFAFAPAEERALIGWASLTAAAAGFAATSIGVYGGVLVPGLLLMGVDARFAAAASLFLQMLVIPLGAGAHLRLGNVRRHVALPLIAGGMIGSFAGPFCAAALSKEVLARAVAGVIVLVGLLVLATLHLGGLSSTRPTEEVPRTRIGGVGLVAGFASGISGAGWGPIGVKLLILLRLDPRQAIGSSLLGRVFMSASAVVAYLVSAKAFEEVKPDPWLIAPLVAGSLSTMIPGVLLVHRLERQRAVVVITLLSIGLALPVLIRGH